MKLLVALAFLALNFYVYNFMARAAQIPPREAFESFPMTLGDWRCREQQSIPANIPSYGARTVSGPCGSGRLSM